MNSRAGQFFPTDFGGESVEGAQLVSLSRDPAGGAARDVSELRLLGNSPAIQKVRDLIGRVAPTDSTVLICGESGCGKELVAESIHAMSPRAGKPFVAINCAAIPAGLLEAELFGHERGGFTGGALRSREGAFERAACGTLLLDEITAMPLELQSRLLRVLETKRLGRVGESADLPVDVRVLASTSRTPAQAFEQGRLREDIYYRLAVLSIHLPALRERGDDVLILADHFLAELNLRNGTHKNFSAELRARFLRHRWPGNVRELRNAVERAYVLRDDELNLGASEMPTLRSVNDDSADSSANISIRIGASLEQIERTFIVATLKHFEGDKRRTADVLGCSLKTLYNKLHAYQRERNGEMN
jgi:DNA-binding NtrC family response regulator